MSSSIVMTLPSRPKVHRLPAPSKKPKKIKASQLFISAAVIIAIASTGITITRTSPEEAAIPEVAEQVKLVTAPEKTVSNTIIIKDESSGIVGQMAKIPTPNVQITEIQGVSNVDKGSGRELLSIVNKY